MPDNVLLGENYERCIFCGNTRSGAGTSTPSCHSPANSLPFDTVGNKPHVFEWKVLPPTPPSVLTVSAEDVEMAKKWLEHSIEHAGCRGTSEDECLAKVFSVVREAAHKAGLAAGLNQAICIAESGEINRLGEGPVRLRISAQLRAAELALRATPAAPEPR